MKATLRLLVVILLLAGWTAAALSLHLVRVPGEWWNSFVVVTKSKFDFRQTYVDTRDWGVDDLAAHPQVVRRLIETGHAEALRHVVGTDVKNLAEKLGDALPESPQTQPASSRHPRSPDRRTYAKLRSMR